MKKQVKTIYKTKNISLRVKGSTFTGELDQALLLKHLKALGLKEQSETVYKLEGEFSVDWDDDIAMPQIESLYIVHPTDNKLDVKIDLDRCFNHKVLLFDGYELQDLLSEYDDGNWAIDRESAAADRAYDSYRDSLME